jgi:uncharacterized protein (TIGR03435 family)
LIQSADLLKINCFQNLICRVYQTTDFEDGTPMMIKGHGLVHRLGFGVVAALIAAVVPAGQSLSQRFEVVSVKPRSPAANAGLGGRGGGGGLTSCAGGPAQIDAKRLALSDTNLYTLITLAYGMGPCVFVHSERISGGPAWMKSDHFEVQAVFPDGTPKYTFQELDDGRASALKTMLQNMLADRFKLALHREMKEMPVYALNVAKAGPKLQSMKQDGCITFDPSNPPATPPKPGMMICGSRGIRGAGGSNMILDAVGIDLDQLSQFLGGFVLDRPVLNQTGIKGIFDMHVRFSPEGTALPALPAFPNPGTAAAEPAASIFTAIQEQLGLQLQSTKAPVDVIVIDHAEKPDAN